jgi:hypothetical protein
MRLPSRSRWEYVLACVLAVAVVLLAGCGGGGTSQKTPAYVRAVDAVASQLDSVTNYLSTPSDPASAADELRTVQRALRKAATELAAITPPPAIRGDHLRLVQAVSDLADGVSPLIAELKSGNLENVQPFTALHAAARARAAIAAITKAGYKIQIELLG